MASDAAGKALGGMVGGALGDAIGELAFGHPRHEALGQALERAGTLRYTDDTAMAIGIAEELAEWGDLDPERLGRRFHDNFVREPWRGYGSGPPTIFAMVEAEGIGYVEAARRLFAGEGSLGNGAAMRIAPVGVFYRAHPALAAKARASAKVTHAHPIGVDGAVIQALAVAQAATLDPDAGLRSGGAGFQAEDFLALLLEAARSAEMRERLALVRRLVRDGAAPARAADAIGRSILVHQSMPFALYAFLTNPESYEACLFCAILNGGDRDTLGAMAGAVSGAYLGVDAIPEPWRRRLENRARIEGLACALAAGPPAP